MFRKILPSLILVLSVLLDISVLPVFSRSYLVPTLALCSVIALGLLLGRTQGTLYGLIGGLLLDVLVVEPIGMMTILFLLSGYLSGIAGRKFKDRLITTVITPMVVVPITELTMIIYLYLCGANITPALFLHALIRVGIETVLVQFLYFLYNVLIRPKVSRYAA